MPKTPDTIGAAIQSVIETTVAETRKEFARAMAEAERQLAEARKNLDAAHATLQRIIRGR